MIKQYNIIKKLICTIICFSLCLTVIIPFSAYASDNKTRIVKVGYFAFDGYHMQDEKGIRYGYGYEMLQRIAVYGGLRYEYIGYDKNWSEMQEMLANGEIDILTSAQKTPERQKRFDFSTTNIGVSSAILTVKTGNNSFTEADYVNWNGIRVGMIEGNSRNDRFEVFAKEHGFTYVPVYFDDTEEMVDELQSGNSGKMIDAILTSNLRRITNEWVLAQFDTLPFYVMVKKGNTEMLDIINGAIKQIDIYEPGLRTKLMNKYYATDNGNEISYSTEERAYIESMRGKTLTALINPDRAPYSWIKNGEFTGILYDSAKEIIKRTGLSVNFIDVKSREQYDAAIISGKVDIRFDSENNIGQADIDNYWLTPSYISVPVGRLYLKKTTAFKKAALPSNRDMVYSYSKKLQDSGLKIIYYDSIEKIIDAIITGKQDEAFLAMDSATMAVRDDFKNKLIVEEVFGDEISYSVAVSRNNNSLLYSIISKATASLDEGRINAIRQTYSENLEKPFSIIGFFYDYPMQIALTVALALGIVILIIVLAAKLKRRKDDLAQAEKDHEQNELLKSALAVAEKAGAAKSQFLSRMSHEMRTPLNAIIGFIELAKGSDKENMDNYIASSDLAAKQLLNVINDVLDMSSIESGKMKISSSPFNFRHLISSITNIYGTQCKQKNINFETKIYTPTEDWIVGDELRINQILMNLLSNAVKFTSEGHIWLTISETAVKEEKVFLRFEITDTGCGISDEMMERLFKPFEQESVGITKKYGGNGLGLSIVKNLVDMMGGTIKAKSIQGEGTTFTVDMPFGLGNVKNQIVLPNKVNSLRVLAVDDQPNERDYIGTVLTRMGVRFTCVGNGNDAITELEMSQKAGDAYNICLIDWQMPGMDGMETTNRIRKKYGKNVVVIVASAYDFQQAGESAKEAGANLFISKPIFQSSLFDLFMTITDGKIAKPKNEPQEWNFTGKRVLLCEDNALNQIVAKGYLAKYNVVVELAENGQIGVDMFKSSAPGYYDAILMDIQMPVMDGFKATKAIRESDHAEAKSIQIIAQTADAFNEDIIKALSAGMNAHIAKPIKPDVLAKTLHKAFSQGKEANHNQ